MALTRLEPEYTLWPRSFATITEESTASACPMAFTTFETRRLEKIVGAFVEQRRPPPHIRPKLDFAFRIAGQSVELFEVRPRYLGAPAEQPVAKATYVKTSGLWRVFWMRADLKWHAYPPAPHVDRIEQFLALVDADEHACFFG